MKKEKINLKNSVSPQFKNKKKSVIYFQKHFLRLQKYGNKSHTHTSILLTCFIGTAIFLFFSLLILFSVNLITNGNLNVQSNIFFSENTINLDKTEIAPFNFGLYHYVFYITPVEGDGLGSLLSGTTPDIAKILGTFVGPVMNWYGILYVCFEALLLVFLSVSFFYFSFYNKFLKYTKEGKRIRRYFNAFYSLLITSVVLGGFITEINVIPGTAIIEPLLEKFVPQFHYPTINKTTTISPDLEKKIEADIQKYLKLLSPGGAGVTFPIAAFTFLHLQIEDIGTNEYFIFNVHSAWWSYIVLAIHAIFILILAILTPFLFKNYKKQKAIIEELVNNNQLKEVLNTNS